MLAVLPIVAAFPAPRPPSSALLTRRSALGLTTSAAASAVFPAQPCLALSDDAAEPEAARKLLELVEGRRPSSWRNEERALVDSLIEEVVALNAPWPRGALIGKWKLAYLQPGPDGTGVDRRVPFPEFDFNDSWQIFGVDSLVNVGELLGPALEVRVSGQLSEDDTSVVTPTPESNRLGSGSFLLTANVCSTREGAGGRSEALPCGHHARPDLRWRRWRRYAWRAREARDLRTVAHQGRRALRWGLPWQAAAHRPEFEWWRRENCPGACRCVNSLSRSGASERAALHGGGGFIIHARQSTERKRRIFFCRCDRPRLRSRRGGLALSALFHFSKHFQFSIGVARGGTCNGNDIISYYTLIWFEKSF